MPVRHVLVEGEGVLVVGGEGGPPSGLGADFGALGGKPDLLVLHVLVEVGGVLVVAVHGGHLLKRVQNISLRNMSLKRLQYSLIEWDA